jgi:hypothetical protein
LLGNRKKEAQKMPSRSAAQHRLMEAAEHDPAVARRTGISVDVAQGFTHADEKDKKWKEHQHVTSEAKKAGMSLDIFSLLQKV